MQHQIIRPLPSVRLASSAPDDSLHKRSLSSESYELGRAIVYQGARKEGYQVIASVKAGSMTHFASPAGEIGREAIFSRHEHVV